MEKKRKIKLKLNNILIALNLLFILVCIFYYGFRFIHYYKIENPKIAKNEKLSELVTSKNNVVASGDGLYKKGTEYFFKGNGVNNYIKYSGRLWRIVSVNEKGQVKMITEENQTVLVWGNMATYETSYVNKWLNKSETDYSGIFYDSLNTPDAFIDSADWCTDKTTKKENKCETVINTEIGLITNAEFASAGGAKSYLNNNSNWWTINAFDDEDVWYVNSKGTLDSNSSSGVSYHSFGVRPIIALKKSVIAISGTGSKENPYIIEKASSNVLNNKSVGEYITYNNSNWRILNRNETSVKVVLDGFVKVDGKDYVSKYSVSSNVFSSTNGIGNYINNDYYKTFTNISDIVDTEVGVNRYDSTTDYDYTKIYEDKVNVKVGLMQIGDLFISDYSGYFLAARTSTYEGTVYHVIDNSRIYADLLSNEFKIRPVISLTPGLTISSGSGTKEKPYVIGG